MYLRANRKGISPVISEIILAATVLTIGSAVWYFSLGYCSITADSYIDDTLELMNTVIERFTVERVSNSTDALTLKVWINNYGEVAVILDVYAYSSNKTAQTFSVSIPPRTLKLVTLDYSGQPLEVGENIQIKVYSRRQNIAYSDYTVH